MVLNVSINFKFFIKVVHKEYHLYQFTDSNFIWKITRNTDLTGSCKKNCNEKDKFLVYTLFFGWNAWINIKSRFNRSYSVKNTNMFFAENKKFKFKYSVWYIWYMYCTNQILSFYLIKIKYKWFYFIWKIN